VSPIKYEKRGKGGKEGRKKERREGEGEGGKGKGRSRKKKKNTRGHFLQHLTGKRAIRAIPFLVFHEPAKKVENLIWKPRAHSIARNFYYLFIYF
jgi:hypothetical protein